MSSVRPLSGHAARSPLGATAALRSSATTFTASLRPGMDRRTLSAGWGGGGEKPRRRDEDCQRGAAGAQWGQRYAEGCETQSWKHLPEATRTISK